MMDERVIWTAALVVAVIIWTLLCVLLSQGIRKWTYKHDDKWWSWPAYMALELSVGASWVGSLVVGVMVLFDLWMT